MSLNKIEPLVEVTRGNIVESMHYGAFAVVDSDGNLLAAGGDPKMVTFMRSSSKPLQILPLLEKGGAEHYHLSEQEIALICSSHSGTDEHVSVLKSLQKKIGIGPEDLQCGISPPIDKATFKRMLMDNEESTTLRQNCSGKHSGMIALAKILNIPFEDYVLPEHPIQKIILDSFADMVGFDRDKIIIGIDGCSVPVFAIPLYNAALGYAKLCDPKNETPVRAEACRTVTKSMASYPFMVAGPDRFDTAIMSTCHGTIVSKSGAEGFQSTGIMPNVLYEGSPGIGICLKIIDGDTEHRARPTVIIEILRKLKAISQENIDDLANYYVRPVKNWRNMEVGEFRPCFDIELLK